MAVSFVAAGAKTEWNDDLENQVAVPSGRQANDILLCFVVNRTAGGGHPSVATAGWARLGDFDHTAGHCSSVFWKRSDGTETQVGIQRSQSAAGACVAAVAVFRGCIATGNPKDQFAAAANEGSDTSAEHPDITPTVENTMVVGLVGSVDDNTWTGPTGGSGLANATERIDIATTLGSDCSLAVWTADKAATTAIGTVTMTEGTLGPDAWWAGVFNLKPEPDARPKRVSVAASAYVHRVSRY